MNKIDIEIFKSEKSNNHAVVNFFDDESRVIESKTVRIIGNQTPEDLRDIAIVVASELGFCFCRISSINTSVKNKISYIFMPYGAFAPAA